MFKFFKKKKDTLEAKPEKFEIELTAAILAYEIARSDGDISKSELDLLLNEVKKITSKVRVFQSIQKLRLGGLVWDSFELRNRHWLIPSSQSLLCYAK